MYPMISIRGMRPALKTSARLPSIRSFHASPSQRYLEPLITSTHTILETVHSATGLPWAYTIPLFALSLRLTVLLPLTIYSRRSQQKQAELTPLLFAWSHSFRDSAWKKGANLGPTVVNAEAEKAFAKKREELFQRYGCQKWKSYIPAAQLPVFLIVIETIRRMCGTRQGLLGLILGTQKEPGTTSDIGVEATFANEGALWFPNLLLPDPELYLPFILGGVMMMNIAPWKVSSSTSVWPRRLTRGLGIMALCVPMLVLKMPTGILIYWLSSSGAALLQNFILDRVMPIKAKVVPCKPKIRV